MEEQYKIKADFTSKSQDVKGRQTTSTPAHRKNANTQFQSSTILSNHTWPKRKNKVGRTKMWLDQQEYDDEESWCEAFEAYSTEEDDHESNGEVSDDSVKPKSQKKNTTYNSSAILEQSQNSLLNHNAPVFVPINIAKSISTTVATPKINKIDNQLSVVEASVGNEITNALPKEATEMPNPILTGRHVYEEGEEEDILNQCRADASIKGDLSPMHSARKKKSHQRERSWDGRAPEEVNIRKLPMRSAKQKQSVQPIVLKPTRLRNRREC